MNTLHKAPLDVTILQDHQRRFHMVKRLASLLEEVEK